MFALRVNQVHWTHFENSVDHAAQLRDLVLCEEAEKGESGRETTLTSPRAILDGFIRTFRLNTGLVTFQSP